MLKFKGSLCLAKIDDINYIWLNCTTYHITNYAIYTNQMSLFKAMPLNILKPKPDLKIYRNFFLANIPTTNCDDIYLLEQR